MVLADIGVVGKNVHANYRLTIDSLKKIFI
jgi:hypothetical protein